MKPACGDYFPQGSRICSFIILDLNVRRGIRKIRSCASEAAGGAADGDVPVVTEGVAEQTRPGALTGKPAEFFTGSSAATPEQSDRAQLLPRTRGCRIAILPKKQSPRKIASSRALPILLEGISTEAR